MATVSICSCGPTTCSSADLNSTASAPCVTRTRPIIHYPHAPACPVRQGGGVLPHGHGSFKWFFAAPRPERRAAPRGPAAPDAAASTIPARGTGQRGSATPRSSVVKCVLLGHALERLDEVDDELSRRACDERPAARCRGPAARSAPRWLRAHASSPCRRLPSSVERSSATSTARSPRASQASSSSSASSDLPAPEGPRSITPVPARTMPVAWTFIGAGAARPWARLKMEREERAGAVGAVLGADRALVRLDDLPRDREAEARSGRRNARHRAGRYRSAGRCG